MSAGTARCLWFVSFTQHPVELGYKGFRCGFLTAGSTTLLIGTEEDQVQRAIQVIRDHCSRRGEKISSPVQLATPSQAYPTEVTVGGATVFVSDVTQFEKI